MKTKMHKLFKIPRNNALWILGILILSLIVSCTKAVEEEKDSEPLPFDFGFGPVTLVAVDVIENANNPENGTARVTLESGTVAQVYEDPKYQLILFLDTPDQDVNLFYSSGRTWLVTPEFEMLSNNIQTRIDTDRDEILIDLPFYNENMSVLAVLGMDNGGFYMHNTVLNDLNYYGFEIGRTLYQTKQQKKQQKREVYIGVSTADEINKANNKGWKATPAQTRPDDGTNPPNNPGPLYKGWPLTFPDNTRFWEYSGTTGFIKRVHIDENKNGKIDPGEPHGYVGRCPYIIGDNTQQMSKDSSTWISKWRNRGQRIVHKFKKFRQPDGSEKYKVESTHQTQQPDGTWKDTKVTAPKTNPIVSDPYQKPNDVPGNSSFGL